MYWRRGCVVQPRHCRYHQSTASLCRLLKRGCTLNAAAGQLHHQLDRPSGEEQRASWLQRSQRRASASSRQGDRDGGSDEAAAADSEVSLTTTERAKRDAAKQERESLGARQRVERQGEERRGRRVRAQHRGGEGHSGSQDNETTTQAQRTRRRRTETAEGG